VPPAFIFDGAIVAAFAPIPRARDKTLMIVTKGARIKVRRAILTIGGSNKGTVILTKYRYTARFVEKPFGA
jgi:hypothetical protein